MVHPTNALTPARAKEQAVLARCVLAASSRIAANDAIEANVFSVASMLLSTTHAEQSNRLRDVSDKYFLSHPGERADAAQIVRNGWIDSLPRFRDQLQRAVD